VWLCAEAVQDLNLVVEASIHAETTSEKLYLLITAWINQNQPEKSRLKQPGPRVENGWFNYGWFLIDSMGKNGWFNYSWFSLETTAHQLWLILGWFNCWSIRVIDSTMVDSTRASNWIWLIQLWLICSWIKWCSRLVVFWLKQLAFNPVGWFNAVDSTRASSWIWLIQLWLICSWIKWCSRLVVFWLKQLAFNPVGWFNAVDSTRASSWIWLIQLWLICSWIKWCSRLVVFSVETSGYQVLEHQACNSQIGVKQ